MLYKMEIDEVYYWEIIDFTQLLDGLRNDLLLDTPEENRAIKHFPYSAYIQRYILGPKNKK